MEIKLRKWNIQDIQPLALLANNPNIANYLRDIFPYPYRTEDAALFVQLCQHWADKADRCKTEISRAGILDWRTILEQGDRYPSGKTSL